MTAVSHPSSLEASGDPDATSAVFQQLRIRCHRNGGRLSLADLDAAERAFRLGIPADADNHDALATLTTEPPPFDAADLLAMLLYAHLADIAATAFASRRHLSGRSWIKRFFRALAEFLVDHYDPAFPARAAAAFAEASRAHGRAISGVALMSGAAGRTAARFCLAPLIEGPAMPPAVTAGFCTRLNAAFRNGSPASPPPQVGLAEVERLFRLIRQTPRLRAWLDDAEQAEQDPAPALALKESIDLEDLSALLAAARPAAP